ncbi:hypothetical protein B296_00020134 [Ensete ventricosum]|uniref:Uncharacterized protein n=1 Tax=Ensete ventricosum TaxID=4639 RepID=A0A426ZJ03_ENSVE|nr:hypothetical protein B296_00020134 [Ensete ventricosum]
MPELCLAASSMPELCCSASPMPELHLAASPMPELRLAANPMPKLCYSDSPMLNLHLVTNLVPELYCSVSLVLKSHISASHKLESRLVAGNEPEWKGPSYLKELQTQLKKASQPYLKLLYEEPKACLFRGGERMIQYYPRGIKTEATSVPSWHLRFMQNNKSYPSHPGLYWMVPHDVQSPEIAWSDTARYEIVLVGCIVHNPIARSTNDH